MRILNLSHFNVWDLGYGKGRPSTYLPLKGLVDSGHRLWWLTSAEETETGDDAKLMRDRIKVVRFKVPVPVPDKRLLGALLSKFYSSAFVLTCFAAGYILARKVQPDLICAHNLIAAFPAFLLSRTLGIPYIVKTYGFFTGLFEKRSYWGKYAFKLPASLYILVNDGTGGDKIARSFGVPADKIAFLVNGIDKDLPSRADLSLRDKLAPHAERIVLSFYRLVPQKQVHLLIEALPQIVKQNSNILFVIAGDGSDRPRLVNLCQELGVSRFVRFEGAIPNSMAPGYMSSADILVSLNSGSSIANPVLEAMCCGKPVIALNTGTTSDLIKHLENGVLLETHELHTLPQVVLSLLDDEELCRSLGKAARQFMLQNWPSWEERVAQEVGLIEGVVERHRQRPGPASRGVARR